MAILLVTYDLRKPGKDYKPVHEYLKRFAYCKDLESVWLLDTQTSTERIREDLKQIVDANDKVLVVRLQQDAAWLNFGCGEWLKSSSRTW
jgi:CRISPR/Cas system-associated endoribonuclease Cas2